MKNQNDLIISIVAIVLALIIAGVCFGTKREPIAPAAPEAVNLAPPALPQGDVVMANSLPGGGGGGEGGPAGGFGGGRGGPGGPGGPAGLGGPPTGGGKPGFSGAK
ncbi:MAG: hypothetical protein H7Y17_02050 [Chlorobia bacterium]|nr:hypothetical protein [Fimbriimonadaceae bacterium]